jgi:hypothetical protein
MLSPGIQEFRMGDLHPRLSKIFRDHFRFDEPIVLCIEKIWDSDLSAFILTDRHAAQISYGCFYLPVGTESYAIVDFSDVTVVVEGHVTDRLGRQRPAVYLFGDDLSTPLAKFPFVRADALYQKFLKTVQSRVGKPA